MYNFADIKIHYYEPIDYIGRVFIYLGKGESKQIAFTKILDVTSGPCYIRSTNSDIVYKDCTFRTITVTSYNLINSGAGVNGYITKRSLDEYWEPFELNETAKLLYGI